jgi:hypothetical protein
LKSIDDSGLTLQNQSMINGQVRGTRESKVAWDDLSATERDKRLKVPATSSDAERVADALFAISAGDVARARELLNAAKNDPLAMLLVDRGAQAKAQATYDAAMTDARRLLEARSWEKASEALGRALDAKRDDAEAKTLRSEVIARIGWRDRNVSIVLRQLPFEFSVALSL